MPIHTTAAGGYEVSVCVRRRRLHRRLPPGTSAGEAKRVEAELIRALHAQPAAAREVVVPGDPPLMELLADYAQRHTKTLRAPEKAAQHAMRIGPWCEGKRASEVRQVVAAFLQDGRPHYAVATLNRSLSALGVALRQAWERGRVSQDYSGACKRLPEHNARHTWLTLEQVREIADATDSERTRATIWICVLTGCRRGEALALRPEMIGRDTITLPAGATKTLRTRTIPIIPPLRPWLKYIGKDGIGLDFEGLKSAWRRAREKAGYPHVQFRDLRRSTGTLLIQSGVPLHHVSQILGHTSTQVTEKVYAHLAGSQLKQSMGALAVLHRGLTPVRKGPAKKRVSA